MMNLFNLISASKKEDGMTLMEVMIAITLLSFVMMGIVTITQNSMNSKDRTVQINKDNLQIENVINRLDWDISQVYSPLYFSDRLNKILDPSMNGCQNCQDVFQFYEMNNRFRFPSTQGLPVPIFSTNGKDQISFLTSSHRRKQQDSKQSHLVWVQYSLESNSSVSDASKDNPISDKVVTGGQTLVRRTFLSDPFGKETINWEEIRPSILMENIQTLEFEFFNPQGKRFDTSLTSWPLGEHIIRGIKMKIVWLDSRGFERKMTRFFRPLWAPIFPVDPLTPQNSNNPNAPAPPATPQVPESTE